MSAATRFETKGRAGKLSGVDTGSAGDGLPVVLVHGINMSSDVWSGVVDRLAGTRRVVAIDLRGHGQSDRSGPFMANDYADDVLAVLDDRGVDRAHVVGTSFGGATACVLAAKAPDRVASIASFGGALAVDGLDVEAAVGAIRAVGVRDFFAGFMPQASFAPGTDQALIDRALDSAANDRDVETVIDVSVAALTADSTAAAEQVCCPALVVTGELDMTCPVPAGEAMAKTLGTELVVLPGRGHVVSMEDPDAVAKLITDHVTKQEG